MKWERWHGFAAAGVLLLGGAYALGRCDRDRAADTADAGAPADVTAQAPADLLAELYVASPNTTWTKLQRGIGGALGILPATMPGMVVAVSDLDAQLSSELDGTAPIYGALAGDPADPAWALAMKLVDGRRARGILVDGDTSRFTGKDAPGMTILVPKRVASAGEKTHEVAITTNGWLLVARKPEDLASLGAWVTRGLTARPPPAGTAAAIVDVPRAALATSLAPKLKALWARAKGYLAGADERMRAERGRAPDFGDPAAIVAAIDGLVTQRIDVVGDLEKARIAIDVTDDAASIEATLTPLKEGAAQAWVARMKTGDATPALSLPASSAVALSMRDDEDTRAAQGKSLSGAIAAALGDRLKDRAPIDAMVDAATKARTESFALALAWDEPSGLFLTAPIRDQASANRAFGGLVDLAKVDPFKEMLRVESVRSGSEEVPGAGKATVATFARAAKPDAGAKPRDSGVAWVADDKTLTAALGPEPLVTLKLAAKSDKRLADEPTLSRFVSAIGEGASTVLVAQPLRFDPKKAHLPAAPVAVAVGKRGTDAFVRIDVPDPLLRELVRMQMGF
ncbi:MAG: hypothetical protein KIT84_38860 [Labilithrix sp.]|nr:hypothetical protein [Labilithrix sp.]MCW5817023.1 hypothetical protein [Labilithrix sp.]